MVCTTESLSDLTRKVTKHVFQLCKKMSSFVLEVSISLTMAAIWLYSTLEIFVKTNFKNKPYFHYYQHILKGGIIENTEEQINVLRIGSGLKIKMDLSTTPCDMIIVSSHTGKKHARRIFYSEIPSYDDMDFGECKFKFISLVVAMKTKRVKISLCNLEETYYIVGNRISPQFIQYLLKFHHDIHNVDEYIVEYMDHNVCTGQVTEKEEIVLMENSYVIAPYVKTDKFFCT